MDSEQKGHLANSLKHPLALSDVISLSGRENGGVGTRVRVLSLAEGEANDANNRFAGLEAAECKQGTF